MTQDGEAARSPEPRRYRALQAASLLLIVGGVVVTAAVVASAPGILSGDDLAGGAERAATMFSVLALGGLVWAAGLRVAP